MNQEQMNEEELKTGALEAEEVRPEKTDSYLLPASIFIAAVLIAGGLVYNGQTKARANRTNQAPAEVQAAREEKVIPRGGAVLPITWGDLGKKMVAAGVIDTPKFEALYAQRGGLSPAMRTMLTSVENGHIVMTPENASALLNFFWVFGLSNKNEILEKGPMQDPQYGGAGRFASTGGWTLAQGNTMSHYSAHQFLMLTKDQQRIVERVAKGIYRPCCGNATYFPDCNHGMAMLGLLELMAAAGTSEEQMYRTALAVNSYWFPDTYLTIAKYMETQGKPWDAVDPREMLGINYSSGQGYQRILTQVQPVERKSSGGCGV